MFKVHLLRAKTPIEKKILCLITTQSSNDIPHSALGSHCNLIHTSQTLCFCLYHLIIYKMIPFHLLQLACMAQKYDQWQWAT